MSTLFSVIHPFTVHLPIAFFTLGFFSLCYWLFRGLTSGIFDNRIRDVGHLATQLGIVFLVVAALAGSGIQTNPPATNSAIDQMRGKRFTRTVDVFPADEVLAEIDREVDFTRLEQVLMEEGLKKFADPQKALLKLIAEKRRKLRVA